MNSDQLNSNGSFISHFRTYGQMHSLPQNEVIEVLIQAYAKLAPSENRKTCVDEYRKRFGRLGAHKHIKHRQSLLTLEEISEYCTKADGAEENRLHQSLVKITDNLLRKSLEQPGKLDTAILTTAMGTPYSPSPLQEVLSKYQSDARHLHFYQMDCYASLPALATADALARTLQNGKRKRHITVLHEELPTFYLKNNRLKSTGNFLSDSLFSDGCIAYDAMPHRPPIEASLELLTVQYRQWADSGDFISICRNTANVGLSKQLTQFVGQCCANLTDPILASLDGLAPNSHRTHVAIHAGGSRLLDVVQSELRLRDEQMRFAWSILRKMGNLESASVLYQIRDMLADSEVRDGDYVLMLAFGPGVTAGFASFRVHKPLKNH